MKGSKRIKVLNWLLFLNTIFKPDHGRTSNNNVTGINYCVNIDETPTDETPCVSNVPF